MSTITINFQNAMLTSTTTQIIVTGGSFALETASALSMSGTISFSSLYVTSGAINFNIEWGTTFNAAVVAPLNTTGGAPMIEITNFAGTVTITWPTASGLQTQQVMSGDPIMLNGYVS
ncbi:hypothetical protein P1X14_19785 [Sphingomonas sp. AOB5]|uniref:hypothetical protein n=1 Tax=Sphingomonas sp. AOB5 TaxID=3034017 RepID=UPI0023F7BC78|nr:hypothetical protein [Sphingomonas sp. AOB5]MDF7777506.1 hypothetical protein [Sphingomonas sp. AOB5]